VEWRALSRRVCRGARGAHHGFRVCRALREALREALHEALREADCERCAHRFRVWGVEILVVEMMAGAASDETMRFCVLACLLSKVLESAAEVVVTLSVLRVDSDAQVSRFLIEPLMELANPRQPAPIAQTDPNPQSPHLTLF